MARKRKQPASAVSPSRAIKRHKQELTLTDLPCELLTTILSHALPDPRDFRWAVDPQGTKKLFTAPILQTSKTLRQACLRVIEHKCIWIRVRTLKRAALAEFRKRLRNLPLLPSRYQYLIAQNAPSIELCFANSSEQHAGNTRAINARTNTLVMPYNFDSLLRVCGLFNVFGDWGLDLHVNTLMMRSNNMSGHFRRDLMQLVMPAVSTIDVLEDIRYWFDGVEYYNTTVEPVGEFSMTIEYLMHKAKNVLHCADTLRSVGYTEESSFLLLCSTWLTGVAEDLLPHPPAWQLGAIDPDNPHESDSTYPGRCPQGNQLRNLLFSIEQGAWLGYANFVDKYGEEWYSDHTTLFPSDPYCFHDEPAFTWFGLSTSDLAKLHYVRARLYESDARQRARRDEPSFSNHELPFFCSNGDVIAFWETQFEDAMNEIVLACRLDPQSECYRRTFERYSEMNEYSDMQREQDRAIGQLVFVHQLLETTGLVDGSTYPRKTVWVGDWKVLESWGGSEAIIRWLPLAQTGLDVIPTVEQWLEASDYDRSLQDYYNERGWHSEECDP